jgi:hypothetical protein
MMVALTTAPISRPPVISPPGPLRAGYLLAARRPEPKKPGEQAVRWTAGSGRYPRAHGRMTDGDVREK